MTEITYGIEILNEYFQQEGVQFRQTVAVRHFSNGRKTGTSQYGLVKPSDIYEKIAKGEDINLNGCYIKGFSLSEYRKSQGMAERDYVSLHDFSARGAFFDCEQEVDFSYVRFSDGDIDFKNAIFANGKVNFHHAQFAKGNLNFSGVKLGRGDVDFQFAEIGEGDITFRYAEFSTGNILFINTKFGDGNVDFKGTNFGNGNVSFHYSKFGDGGLTFESASFGGGKIDFRKVEFGTGKTDFRRVSFGDGEVSFEESEFKNGRINFRSSSYGAGKLSFEMVDFGDNEVIFDNADFGTGDVSFLNTKLHSISFKRCHLNNYLDLRVEKATRIDLSDTIVRDVVDFKPATTSVKVKELCLIGMRNLGRIFIDWKENKVYELIAKQKNSTNRQKSNQFRILKEDFRNNGQYEEEDKAYVEFKRFELKADKEEMLAKSNMNAIWVYPLTWFKWIVFDKIGLYATDPLRVLTSMGVIYILFSLLYYFLPNFIDATIQPSVEHADNLSPFFEAFYHSAITYLTIGYGDYYPLGFFRWLSAFEGWVGLFLMAYFTVAFVRKILR